MLNIEYANRSQGEPGTCWDRSPSPQRAYVYRAHDCYGNYLRLYLPQGAQMVNPPRFPIPPSYLYVDDPAAGQFGKLPDEQGKEVYGGLIVVPIGRSVTAPFTTGSTLSESLHPPRRCAVYRLSQKLTRRPALPVL